MVFEDSQQFSSNVLFEPEVDTEHTLSLVSWNEECDVSTVKFVGVDVVAFG